MRVASEGGLRCAQPTLRSLAHPVGDILIIESAWAEGMTRHSRRGLLSLTQIGSLLGVAAFFLSGYQWLVAQQQIRVSAAIDISKSYLQNRELREAQSTILKTTEPELYSENWLRERAFVDLNDYIARLANEGLIDNAYVSSRVKCDIAWIDRTANTYRKDLAGAAKQISAYVKAENHRACPER